MEIQTIRTQICFLPLDNFSLGNDSGSFGSINGGFNNNRHH